LTFSTSFRPFGPVRALLKRLSPSHTCSPKLSKIIDDILEMLNKNGLTSYQSLNVLERLGGIIEMGQRVAKGTTH